MRRFMVIAGMLMALPLAVMAQETVPKAELFAGYSYLRLEKVDQNGWNGSLDANLNKNLGFVVDVAGHYGSQSASVGTITNKTNTHLYTVMVGPRVSDPRGKWNTFAQALFGWARLQNNLSSSAAGNTFLSSSNSGNGFAFTAGGGVDYQWSPTLSIRLAQVEYQFIRSQGVKYNGTRVAAGILLRWGRRS